MNKDQIPRSSEGIVGLGVIWNRWEAAHLPGRSRSVSVSMFLWGTFLSPLCLLHLPVCCGAGKWVFVHNEKFHFVFWELQRTNNVFKVSMWPSKAFPRQKVLNMCFLRPSRLHIMGDASAFKDVVVCSLVLLAIPLALLFLPRLFCSACGFAESCRHSFPHQLHLGLG